MAKEPDRVFVAGFADLRRWNQFASEYSLEAIIDGIQFSFLKEQKSTAGVTTTSGQLIPNLPDDISLQCIARVPRSYHSSLSAVSKSWRSTLRSPELFNTRYLLRSTQQSLYLIDSSMKWYILYQNPKADKTPKFLLSPLPPPLCQPIGAAFAVVGPKIYVMGGSVNEIPSNNVSIFDCRFGTWEIGPEMKVCRMFQAAAVVNEKIYVMGGYVGPNFVKSMNWIEVYDPVIGAWDTISSTVEIMCMRMCANVLDGKIYARHYGGGVVYNAVTEEWSSSLPGRFLGIGVGERVVVDGVMYYYDYVEGNIRGYNVELDAWNVLKGIESIVNRLWLPMFSGDITMTNLNGKLCVVWDRIGSMNEVEIMCAEIEVWKDDDVGGGLSGSVLWSDMILSVPFGSRVAEMNSISVEL